MYLIDKYVYKGGFNSSYPEYDTLEELMLEHGKTTRKYIRHDFENGIMYHVHIKKEKDDDKCLEK